MVRVLRDDEIMDEQAFAQDRPESLCMNSQLPFDDLFAAVKSICTITWKRGACAKMYSGEVIGERDQGP